MLISTYNWPEALKSVLESLKAQLIMPNEVLIADDGSGEATKKVVESFSESLAIPVQHIWQEDNGFRKSEILNKAIAATTADYIIQVDGDCIMHKNFVQDHMAQVAKGCFLFGSRVNIKPESVEVVLSMAVPRFSFFSGDVKNKTRNLRIPYFQKKYKPTSNFSEKTRGCNLSYWRNDFLAVNGYDESIAGWGREDSEFVLRLLNNNVKGKRLRYGGIVYHIYHPEKSKEHVAANHRIQENTIASKKTWCENGVQKHLTNN